VGVSVGVTGVWLGVLVEVGVDVFVRIGDDVGVGGDGDVVGVGV
jgi:hypothetical protein